MGNTERVEIINSLYSGHRKDTRLLRSRHGQLEYLTTMHYIHKLVPPESKVLEVGAGTGRYSIALARQGYDVAAVELVADNLEILRQNASGLGNVVSYQGDAEDLSFLRMTVFTQCSSWDQCIIFSKKRSSTRHWTKRFES